jgi:hypothetical protein
VAWEMITLAECYSATNRKLLDLFKEKPTIFFAERVKTLCVSAYLDISDALQVLPLCTGVVNLACWVDPRQISSPTFFDTVSSSQPRRLSIDTETFFGWGRNFQQASFSHRFFENVTHLELLFRQIDIPLFAGLHLLPQLTHLALDPESYDVIPLNFLSDTLRKCISLHVLIAFEGVDQGTDASAFIKDASQDDRLVVLPCGEYIRNWEAFRRGLPDVWTQAERIISERLRRKRSSSIQTTLDSR